MMLLHHRQSISHCGIRRDCHRIVDHSVFSPLHTTDLIALLFNRHILVNHSDTSGSGHCYRHIRLGHGVHRGGNDRGVELNVR